MISVEKTAVMYQSASDKAYSEPSIYVYGQKLQFAEKFVYLISTVNMKNTLDDKISL